MKAPPPGNPLASRGFLAGAVALVVVAIILAEICRPSHRQQTLVSLRTFAPATSNQHFSVTRPIPELASRPAFPAVAARSQLQGLPSPALPLTNDLLSIHVPPDPNAPPTGPYAPTGRMVQCALFIAADSAITDAPLLALVVWPIWFNGVEIIPVGAEVHGRAQYDRVRDRILSQSRWTIVWQDGRELSVRGTALNRDIDPSGEGWSLVDGLKGIQGQIVRGQSLDEVKLFLATALAGFAQGLQQQTTTVLGAQFVPSTARNAGINATTAVLNTYAGQVLETIKRDGLTVMVPSGKNFYLYVEEPIDLDKARVAGGRLPPESAPAPAASPPRPVQEAIPVTTTAFVPTSPKS